MVERKRFNFNRRLFDKGRFFRAIAYTRGGKKESERASEIELRRQLKQVDRVACARLPCSPAAAPLP